MGFKRLVLKRVSLIAMVVTVFLFSVPFSIKMKKASFQRDGHKDTFAVVSPVTNQQQPSDAMASGISPFLFTIEEPNICTSNPDLFALIYIHTAPEHLKHRTAIRQMFGGTKRYGNLLTTTVFFLGKSSNADLEQAVQRESAHYHDIVQADYTDSYRNLTLKALSALHWIIQFCPHTKYLIKLDDDIFVNIFRLIRYMDDLDKTMPDKMLLHCKVDYGDSVHREKENKWYVRPEEYKGDIYPDFCFGQFFFYRFPVATALLNASKMVPFFWLDDVYLTGDVAKLAGIKHNNLDLQVNDPNIYDIGLIQGKAVFAHMNGKNGVNLQYKYWQKVLLQEKLTNF